MMVSPALGDLAQKAIAYSRFAGREGFSSVPPKLNELAILIVAKHWYAEYVWSAHHQAGVHAGLPAEVVEAVRVGRRPASMEKDVEAVYNFTSEFLTTRKVSDVTLRAAKAVLGGDRGVVDLVGTMALYQISSMMVSLDETPLAEGVKPYLH
jgi:4-carboxymuconolactone decarboxylase